MKRKLTSFLFLKVLHVRGSTGSEREQGSESSAERRKRRTVWERAAGEEGEREVIRRVKRAFKVSSSSN